MRWIPIIGILFHFFDLTTDEENDPVFFIYQIVLLITALIIIK